MNSLALAAAACTALYLGYRFYGGFFARLWNVDPERKTPAVRRRDGVDYIPARHWVVLFGHHFASIAGAGPIVGPVLACAVWGWLPALLWVVIGAIFLGAVHDFSALMASLRAEGKSIADIAETHLGHRVRLIFGAFLWVALVLVVAVFLQLAAQTFVMKPQMVIPTFGLIPAALLAGVMMYRWEMRPWIATVIGLAILTMLMVVGYYRPVALPWEPGQNHVIWMLVLGAYCYCASILPVNILLQPRDYLSTFLLIFGMGAGYVGLALTHPKVQAPPFVAFSGSLGMLWPMLFVTIACGAISGFHSLVASGTTSKQLANEADAPRIGFGAMIVEGAVGVLTIMAVVAGLRWGAGDDTYAVMLRKQGPLVTYATGYSHLTAPLLGSVGGLIALTVLNAFVLTTLDTATRITRYVSEELFGEGLGIKPLRSRWISTLIVVECAFYLALFPLNTVWRVFGSANQLIGALALLVVTVVLQRLHKPTLYTLVPAIFMLVTTVGALVFQAEALLREKQVVLVVIAWALVLLSLMMVADSVIAVRKNRG